jgi:hypothetical protein
MRGPARHDCFGARACSGLALPLPRQRLAEGTGGPATELGRGALGGRGRSVFRETVRLDAAGSREQLHRAPRRPDAAGGQVGYVVGRDPFAVELARFIRELAVGQSTRSLEVA